MLEFYDELALIASKIEDEHKFPFPTSCSQGEACTDIRQRNLATFIPPVI